MNRAKTTPNQTKEQQNKIKLGIKELTNPRTPLPFRVMICQGTKWTEQSTLVIFKVLSALSTHLFEHRAEL